MTPDQLKRRDELAQEFDKASWGGGRTLEYFKAGYTAGYEDSEVRKAVCCMEMEEQNKELTRKLEIAKKALDFAENEIHSEFCGKEHHEYCVVISDALKVLNE